MNQTMQSLIAELMPAWMLSPAGDGKAPPPPDGAPPPDAPTWTPDVKEPDPDLLPDESLAQSRRKP